VALLQVYDDAADHESILRSVSDKIRHTTVMSVEINKDDELADLAQMPGTRCVYIGDQLLLLEPGHEVMVTVSNGKRSVICSAAKAATFNLYPEES
jgi:hypothetical protein